MMRAYQCSNWIKTSVNLKLIYLEPLDLDELLESVDDEEPLLLVVDGDVAGVEPTALPDHLLRRLRVLEVPFHDLQVLYTTK